MRVVISDVCVFFDLYQLRLLPEFFALDMEVYTTDFVYNEIVQVEQIEEFAVFVRSKKLQILKVTSEEEIEIKAMKLTRANKSFPDKTMLWKALKMKSLLLTCDGKLRKEAEDAGIEVHGSIWVIEKLMNEEILTNAKGIEALEELKEVNARLPYDIIAKLIKQLQ